MIDLMKKNEIIQNIKLFTDYILEIPAFTSCLDCKSWNGKTDKCERFGLTPPPKVIVEKCDAFDLDIPF